MNIFLEMFLFSLLIISLIVDATPHRRRRRLKGGNFKLKEIETTAQRAVQEADELMMIEATRRDHPMIIARNFDLAYEPNQVGNITDDHLGTELQQNMLYNTPDKFGSLQTNQAEKGTDDHVETELQQNLLYNTPDKFGSPQTNQAEKGTDGHLETELQQHQEGKPHLFYNIPDKIDNAATEKNSGSEFHLFYDVGTAGKSQNSKSLPQHKASTTLAKALPLLEQIAREIIVEEQEREQPSQNGFPCQIDGLWTSRAAGVKLNLTTAAHGKVLVNISNARTSNEGLLHDCAWHISGLVPSKREGPFAMAGVCSPQHRIATFIGQCKVCSDIQTIFGNWMFSRIARDCNEAMAAIDIKPDVWLKDNVQNLEPKQRRNNRQ